MTSDRHRWKVKWMVDGGIMLWKEELIAFQAPLHHLSVLVFVSIKHLKKRKRLLLNQDGVHWNSALV